MAHVTSPKAVLRTVQMFAVYFASKIGKLSVCSLPKPYSTWALGDTLTHGRGALCARTVVKL